MAPDHSRGGWGWGGSVGGEVFAAPYLFLRAYGGGESTLGI
jgi:hypothetical protein